MPRQIPDVPQRVGLALEQGNDDGPAGGQREQGALEEVDQQLLVVAHLAVDVGRLAAHVREVEDDAVHCSRLFHPAGLFVFGFVGDGRHASRVDVVENFATRDGADLVDVGAHVGVFRGELVKVLFVDSGGQVGAVVVLDQGDGEAEVAIADEEDVFVGAEGY